MTEENDRGLTDPEDAAQNISGWFQDPEDSSKQRFKLYSHGNDIIDYTAKLFQEENDCDCHLVARGGIVIPIHKLMLIKCSFLWRILLKSSCCYGRCDHGLQTATVFLPDISFRHLSIVVKFLYSGMFDETIVGKDKESVIAIFKLFGFPLGSVNWCKNIEGYENCPNCDEYLHKDQMLKHLVKVHVEEPCAKDLAAFEEKKELMTPHCCTECEASKSDKPYYVQYNMDDTRESIVNHYKQEHFEPYCQFQEGRFKENQQDRDKLFERDVVQKVQNAGLPTEFQSRQDWDRLLDTAPSASTAGPISPPRPRDEDSDAESCDFSGNMDSNIESSDDDEPNECVKCNKVFVDTSEYRSHTAYKCPTCSLKILHCQKDFHDKTKHDKESPPRKGTKSNKRKRSGVMSRSFISSSSSSDEEINRIKPGQALKRKKNVLDDSSDEDLKVRKGPRRPSSSSGPRRPPSSSKICQNGDDSDCEGASPKNHTGVKKKCKECKKEISSEHFERHVVTHNFHWWDQDIPKDINKCPIGSAKACKKEIAGWKRVVIHIALQHKQLETKLKLNHKELKDFEIPLNPPTNDISYNNNKTKKPETMKPVPGALDSSDLLTHSALLLGDKADRVPSLSSLDNVDDILNSSGSNQEDVAPASRKLHLDEVAPPIASSRPSPPKATSRPNNQYKASNHPPHEEDRTNKQSASNHSHLENSALPSASSSGLDLDNGSVPSDSNLKSFQPISSQIEIDNAELDASLPEARVGEENGGDDSEGTDPWEDGFHSDN